MHVLLDQEYGDAALVDLADDMEVLLHQPGREPERRLIDQQKFWRAHQPAADRHHRLLAARHGARQLRPPLRKTRINAKDIGHARLRDLFRRLLIGAHTQVFLDRKPGKHLAPLGDAGNASRYDLVGGNARNVGAVENDASGARRRKSENRTDKRGFAGTVRAKKAGDAAGFHG